MSEPDEEYPGTFEDVTDIPPLGSTSLIYWPHSVHCGNLRTEDGERNDVLLELRWDSGEVLKFVLTPQCALSTSMGLTDAVREIVVNFWDTEEDEEEE